MDTAGTGLAFPRRAPCACGDTKALAPWLVVSSSGGQKCSIPPHGALCAAPTQSAVFAVGATAVELVIPPAQTSATLSFESVRD